MIRFFEFISTGFYIGRLKYGPTIATFLSIPLIFSPHKIIIFSFLLLLSIIGSYVMVKKTNLNDPQEVVIDEILAYFFIFLFIKVNFMNVILGFLLFRLIDALKPFPIKLIEKIPYLGIILDDLIASVYVILILFINPLKF